jgi:hypothetical protein
MIASNAMISATCTTKDRSSTVDFAKNNFFQTGGEEAIGAINQQGAVKEDLLLSSSYQNQQEAPFQRVPNASKHYVFPSIFSSLISKADSVSEKSKPATVSSSELLVHNSGPHPIALIQSSDEEEDMKSDYLSKAASSSWQSKCPALGSILNFAQTIQLTSKKDNRREAPPIAEPTSEHEDQQEDTLDSQVPDSTTTKRKRIVCCVNACQLFGPPSVRHKRFIACEDSMIKNDYSPNRLALEFDHEILELLSDTGSLSNGCNYTIEHSSESQRNGKRAFFGSMQKFVPPINDDLNTSSKHVGVSTKAIVPTELLAESQPGPNNDSLLASLLDEFEDRSKHFTRQRGDSVLDLILEEESNSFPMFEKASKEGQEAPSAKEAGQRLFNIIGDLLPSEAATAPMTSTLLLESNCTHQEEAEASNITVDIEVELTSPAPDFAPMLTNCWGPEDPSKLEGGDPVEFHSGDFPDESSYQVDDDDGDISLDTSSSTDDHLHNGLESANGSANAPSNCPQAIAIAKFKQSMAKTTITQGALQEWDRANGLPKSHCQTMVNSSRSREQLLSGLILQKWNGVPLLNLPGAKINLTRRMFRGSKVTGLGA